MNGLKIFWENFERWISMVLIAFLTLILFLEVLFRYVFYKSMGWIGEVSGFVFVWFIYLSMSHITGKNTHIRVEVLDLLLPKSWLKYVDLPMDLLWLAFNGLMFYFGVQLVYSVVEFPYRTAILDISMAYLYSIIPLSFGLMTIRMAIRILQNLRTWSKQ